MASFGISCSKTLASNLDPAVTILPQFQKFRNLANNLKFCEPGKKVLLETE